MRGKFTSLSVYRADRICDVVATEEHLFQGALTITFYIDVFLSYVLRLYQGCLKKSLFQTYMYAVFKVHF